MKCFKCRAKKNSAGGRVDKIGLETAVATYHVYGRRDSEVFVKPVLGHISAIEVILQYFVKKWHFLPYFTDEK